MEEVIMRCPYCESQGVHLQSVEVNRGGEITMIELQGTKVRAGEAAGRGVRMEMIFWCEVGHKWRQSLQFHKGTMFQKNELLLCGCPNCCQGHDLWRD